MKREEILKILETWTDANSTDYSECADAILALEQKEQPEPERSNLKTAEEYVIKTWGKEWLDHDWEAGDVIDALCEYRSQGLPEVTDEMIEQLLMHVDYVPMNEKVDVVRRWVRKQLTGK